MPAAVQQCEVHILKDNAAIARRAAEEFVKVAQSAVQQHGSFSVALSGGSTPKLLYALLATDPELRGKVRWVNMQIFFGEQRHVAPDDPQSNFKMSAKSMFNKAPLKPKQIHRMKGEYPDAEKAAQEYEQGLRTQLHLKDKELPRFDLVLAGMGDEGHTLSLFPGTKALHPEGRAVVRNWVGKLAADRITATAPAVNNAGMILFMVAGKDKAPALKAVLEGPYEPEQLPAQLLQPTNGKLLWLVDEAAGSMLSNAIRE